MITLESSHIIIPAYISEKIFGPIFNAYMAFNSEEKRVYLSPVTSDWFKLQFPSTDQVYIKDKNNKGDKSISIQGLLIDNDLNETDRELSYELEEEYQLLKVNFDA